MAFSSLVIESCLALSTGTSRNLIRNVPVGHFPYHPLRILAR